MQESFPCNPLQPPLPCHGARYNTGAGYGPGLSTSPSCCQAELPGFISSLPPIYKGPRHDWQEYGDVQLIPSLEMEEDTLKRHLPHPFDLLPTNQSLINLL